MRIKISLPDEQAERLAKLCRDEGISRAEAVRRAVRRYLEEHRPARGEDAFGMWRGRQADGPSYERSIRSEWS